MTTVKGPAVPLLQVGDRVRVKAKASGVSATNGLRGHTVTTGTMRQSTGKITKVINRHLYYVELDEPLVVSFHDTALEKI